MFWSLAVGLVALASAFYLASYGLWAARQKNWLGAVGIWTVALITLAAPVSAIVIHWLGS